jgi:hypothetical protein
MSLFKPAENTMAYFKAGFMGEAGSGKTHTATLVAIGLVQHLKKHGIAGADKPAMILDTENGSSWIKPMFDEAGIPLLVAKTRAFRDLEPALREAEKGASILLIDSITHFWEELQASYLARLSERKGRTVTRLEFQDWNFIKGQWRKFSDIFVGGNLHCILCGRLGWEYENTEDENGKKQIEKSGAKMQAEKGLGYEPNILVWMERNMDLKTKVVARTATVLKDRSRKLDGKQFPNPTFATFLPHIEFMALGGKHEAADTTRTSEDIMPGDEGPMDLKSVRRGIILEEIEALLVKHHPSMGAEDKKAKAALVLEFFGTPSWTEISRLMPLVELQANYDSLHRHLERKPSRYGVPDITADEIPHLEPDKKADTPASEPTQKAVEIQAMVVPAEPDKKPDTDIDDRETIIRDFEAEIANETDDAMCKALWDATAQARATMTEEQVARIKKAYGKALMIRNGKPGRGKVQKQKAA